MTDVVLVFPHQLFDPHPAVQRDRLILLVEDSLFFGDARYPLTMHTHKLVLHRASMKAYEAGLRDRGYTVQYVDYDPDRTLSHLLQRHVPDQTRRMHVAELVDYVLEKRLQKACRETGWHIKTHASPMFLTPAPVWRDQMGSSTPYRMARFYRRQRLRLNILVHDGKPEGGQWSFDSANRKKWPAQTPPPDVPAVPSCRFVDEARAYVRARFPNHPGAPDTFNYPVTHEQAKGWLNDFLRARFHGFGACEDAMVAHASVLNHSVLTPMLNIGLLTPDRVVHDAIVYARAKNVPLNSLEGFVRQIIGWREFIRVLYETVGVRQRTSNFWHHTNPMPRALYEGTTGMPPVDAVIGRVRQRAYTHHIERLMVLGNFMALCEIHPDHVYRWFMELFIDAYDWVMVPNVYGMSQFADGGLMASKPYISGSNYLLKMSDFKRGPWCETWDDLFWRFMHKHRAFFDAQPRLAMLTHQLDRMGASGVKARLKTADAYLSRLC